MKEELKEKLDEFILKEKEDEKSKKTLIDYKNAVNKFIDFIPKETTTLTKDLLIEFKNNLTEKDFAVKSKNKYITIVNKFLKFIDKKDLTLKKFKEQRKTSIDDPIWEQEHKRMLRWAKKLGQEDTYLIIKIFATTGARIEELKFFTVENLENNYIKGTFNKGKYRTLIMTNELKRELKLYCKQNKIKSGYIFISTDPKAKEGAMWNNSTIWRRLKRIARAAKINPSKIHPHAWRHLFAKECKRVGIDLDELQDILGHNDIKTTAIYTQTSNAEKKQKLERLWKK